MFPLRRADYSAFCRVIQHTIVGKRFSSLIKREAEDKYCMDLVRRCDYENFVTGLLIPESVRGTYFAVRAFNVEVCSITEQVRQNPAQAGHMRFQFWKDALSQINCGSLTLKHPVAQSLAYYVKKDELTVRWLERCLEAR